MRRLRVKFRGYTLTGDATAYSLTGQAAQFAVGLPTVDGSFTLAQSNMDATTWASYSAALTTGERAAIIVSVLGSAPVVEVVDGVGNVRAAGTMAAPWASALGATVLVGELDASALLVSAGGTPDATWTLRFRNGARSVNGSFGLAGSGRQFVWSTSSFATGGRATLGAVSLVASGGAAVTTEPVTTFQVTSATTGLLPWAFGHAFRQADVPAGYSVTTSDAIEFQATPTTYWPDGSVKHAIIAGRSTFSAPGTVTVNIARGAASGGTLLAIADLKAAIPASTSVTVGGTTMALSGAFLDSPQRVVCSGPVMSNWIYRLPVASSNHLVIWADVRLYKGGAVEVFPWVENGYLQVASPTNAVVSCAVSIGGVSRFSQSIDVKHHTRVPLVTGTTFSYWTTDPQITPKHDSTYLISTKLVPNYGYGSPSDATLNSAGLVQVTQSYTPNWIGDGSAAMDTTGWQQRVGPHPANHALYVTSGGDVRAYRSMLANALAAGSWSVHARDEITNEPINFADRPTLQIAGLPGTGGTNHSGTPAGAAHQPQYALIPWLVTGRWWFLDEALMWVGYNYLWQGAANRQNALGVYLSWTNNETRGAAWAIAHLAHAAAIVPSGHPCRAALLASVDANIDDYHARYIAGTLNGGTFVNNLGVLGQYSSTNNSPYGTPGGIDAWHGAPWMEAYFSIAFGEVANMGLPITQSAKLAALRLHAAKFVVGMCGDGTGGTANWRRAGAYSWPMGTDSIGWPPNTWYSDHGQAYAAYCAAYGLNVSAPATSGLAFFDNESELVSPFDDLTVSFLGMTVSGLAYAVDAGAPGATDAYLRVLNSATWASYSSNYRQIPTWGVVPRVPVGLPTWLSSAPIGQWVDVPNSTLSTLDAANPISSQYGSRRSKVTAWCGGALKRAGSVYMLGAAGGHGDYAGNEVNVLALNTNSPGWTQPRPTSLFSDVRDKAPAYADGRRAATHNYYSTQFDQVGNRMFIMPCPGMDWAAALPQPGPGYPYSDLFVPMAYSVATADWEPFSTHSTWPGAGGDYVAATSFADPLTGEMYYARSGVAGLWRYNPATKVWTRMGTSIFASNYSGSALDHTRGRALVVGDFSGTVAPRVWTTAGAVLSVTFGGLGDSVLRMNNYPGVVYDEARDSFLVFPNAGVGSAIASMQCYEVNASTFNVSTFSMSNVPVSIFNPTSGAFHPRPNGVLNAIQYVPELKGVVFHNDYSGPVKFMRTT